MNDDGSVTDCLYLTKMKNGLRLSSIQKAFPMLSHSAPTVQVTVYLCLFISSPRVPKRRPSRPRTSAKDFLAEIINTFLF
jgi:hypothetical protein